MFGSYTELTASDKTHMWPLQFLCNHLPGRDAVWMVIDYIPQNEEESRGILIITSRYLISQVTSLHLYFPLRRICLLQFRQDNQNILY